MRLDALLTQKGLVESRAKAQALIMAGKVLVDGQVITKAGTQIVASAVIDIQSGLPYVSRGGLKLAAGLDVFDIDPAGTICADVGASTGGFTDVLLQRGAVRVYAIDVGYGQLAWKLRQDSRVIVMERTNARHLETLPEPVNLTTIDASFISLRLLLPAVRKWLVRPAYVIALVKPQFEAGKGQVGKGGVVRDRAVHRQVLEKALAYAIELDFQPIDLTPSPVKGPAGNYEFLLLLGWHTAAAAIDPSASVTQCLSLINN